MDISTPQGFLQFALTPAGVGIIAGFVTSVLAEAIPGWADIPKRTKTLLMLALNFVIPLFASFALGLIDRESLWFALSIGYMVAFPAYGANQATHKISQAVGLKT